MGKVEYDFREGLDQEKLIYKNKSWDWRSFLGYIGYLLFTWTVMAAFFALFFYAYIYHPDTAFWVYIGVWLAFAVALLTVIITNLALHYKAKKDKKERRHMEEERKTELERKEREEKIRQKQQKEREMVEIVNTNQNEDAKLNR